MIYVYLTVNTINGKIYVGVHENKSSEIDGYIGSGKLIKRAIEKHGKDNFKKFIIKVFDNVEAAMEFEKCFVDTTFVESDFTYNVRIGGGYAPPETRRDMEGENNPFFGRNHSEETKKIIAVATSKLKKGVSLSDEHKNNISKALKGKQHTKERGENISKAKKGKPSPFKGVKFTDQIVCPHCGTIGTGKSNMTRWHFDNCKRRNK